MNVVVTWMYSSPEGESIHHAQVGSASGTQKVRDLYWRCVFLLFESSARLNSDARHIRFINEPPPPRIDGIATEELIRQFEIELVEFPTVTKSPADYYGAWNTQFIVLDVLDGLREMVRDDDAVLLLDSDIVFNQPISVDFLESLRTHRALLYSIEYGEARSINGLTRIQLAAIARDMSDQFAIGEFTYSGGEFACFLGSEVAKIADLGREAYSTSLDRHREGLAKFHEEAHLLSYVYHLLGYPTHTANPYIKRIWTQRSVYSNVDGGESDLMLWHLPAEKKRGFVKVFRSFEKRDGGYRLPEMNFRRAFHIEESGVSAVLTYLERGARHAHRGLKNVASRFF